MLRLRRRKPYTSTLQYYKYSLYVHFNLRYSRIQYAGADITV